MSNKHRKIIYPIEWLRAIAVLSVVLYHYDKNLLPGGYLGVDIFLVISGYLVGGSLATTVNLNFAKLYQFINKRFWRLQPALFFTIFVCIILAAFLTPPQELIKLGENSISTLIGLSNIYFWTSAGYFGGSGEYNWLLHTWSLSLEWQYYISFALLCIIYIVLFKKTISLYLLITISILSFSLAVIFSSIAPSANFFLLPTRLWEFITGTIVFILCRNHNFLSLGKYSPVIFFISLSGLLISVIKIDETIALPSWQTLIPVLLTGICLATSSFRINKYYLFITKPLFTLGQSSYSIYLMHWPLIVAFGSLTHSNWYATFILFFSIALIGYLMFVFIELPFNKYKQKFLLTFTISILSITALAIIINLNDGFKARFSSKQLTVLESANLVNHDRKYCLNVIDRNDNEPLNKNCKNTKNEFNIIFWGDSHLEALRSPFLEMKDYSVDFLGVAGCPPVLMLNRIHGSKQCHVYSKEALKYIKLHSTKYNYLVIGGRFSAYMHGNTSSLGRAEGGLNQYVYDVEFPKQKRLVSLKKRMNQTISELTSSDITIIILGGIPEFGESIPRELFKNSIFNIPESNNQLQYTPLKLVNERQGAIDVILKEIANNNDNVYFYDPKEILCENSICFSTQDGMPIYFDNDHLNKLGAEIVIRNFISSMSIN